MYVCIYIYIYIYDTMLYYIVLYHIRYFCVSLEGTKGVPRNGGRKLLGLIQHRVS